MRIILPGKVTVSLHTNWPGRAGRHEARITKVNGRKPVNKDGGVSFGVAPTAEVLTHLAFWKDGRVEGILPVWAVHVQEGEWVNYRVGD